jgi:hypothetical protein
MILNDALTKQSIFTNITLVNGSKELPKELKVKVMRIRMAYNKIKKNMESEIRDFFDEFMTDEFKTLRDKKERTDAELERFNELSKALDSDYKEFLIQKGTEDVGVVDDVFTEDEYADIVDVNSGENVEINGRVLTSEQFLEIIYELFVK